MPTKETAASPPLSAAKPSKAVVTGGAGFIGSNLIASLLADGKTEVICIDNLFAGSLANLQPFLGNPLFKFVQADICNKAAIEPYMHGADVVYHQAAIGSVPRSFIDPIFTHRTNTEGFLNVLLSARDAGVRRFVYASSSSVYGDSPTLPKVEDQTGNLLSPYAATKMMKEHYARLLTSSPQHGQMSSVGLRYFNVFGPNQSPEGAYAAVIPKFLEAIKHKQPIGIYGDGAQTRDFTYVDNVVQANLKAGQANVPNGEQLVCNIGCGERITVLEMAQHLVKIANGQSAIEHLPPRMGDIRDSLANIDSAKANLGYHPTIDVREGLKRTYAWFAKQA